MFNLHFLAVYTVNCLYSRHSRDVELVSSVAYDNFS